MDISEVLDQAKRLLQSIGSVSLLWQKVTQSPRLQKLAWKLAPISGWNDPWIPREREANGITNQEVGVAWIANWFLVWLPIPGLGEICTLLIFTKFRRQSRYIAYHALQSLFIQLFFLLSFVYLLFMPVVTKNPGAFQDELWGWAFGILIVLYLVYVALLFFFSWRIFFRGMYFKIPILSGIVEFCLEMFK